MDDTGETHMPDTECDTKTGDSGVDSDKRDSGGDSIVGRSVTGSHAVPSCSGPEVSWSEFCPSTGIEGDSSTVDSFSSSLKDVPPVDAGVSNLDRGADKCFSSPDVEDGGTSLQDAEIKKIYTFAIP